MSTKTCQRLAALAACAALATGCGAAHQQQAAGGARQPETIQQQITGDLIGMPDQVGATVTSATVGTLYCEKQDSDGAYNQVACSGWQDPGVTTLADSELSFSDGTRDDAQVVVTFAGNGTPKITWGPP